MHLGDDKDAAKPKGEHRPQAVSIHHRYERAVRQHDHLQRRGPPAVEVDACVEQTALQQEQEHVEESDHVTAGRLHRVVPKGIDRGPGKKVAVVLAGEAYDLLTNGQLLAKEDAAPVVLHE